MLQRPLVQWIDSDTTLELAAMFSMRSRWPLSRAKPSVAPGYARFSFALGDDDLAKD